jgi:hypothetical protein
MSTVVSACRQCYKTERRQCTACAFSKVVCTSERHPNTDCHAAPWKRPFHFKPTLGCLEKCIYHNQITPHLNPTFCHDLFFPYQPNDFSQIIGEKKSLVMLKFKSRFFFLVYPADKAIFLLLLSTSIYTHCKFYYMYNLCSAWC